MSNIGLRIKKIRKVGKGRTYDLSVPKFENFFLGNGVLSHNSGKTWTMTTLAQLYHSKFNYKIIDLYGGKFKEEGFWCFPIKDISLWKKFEQKVGLEFKNGGGKEYFVNLLIPCFSSNIPKEVPQHLPKIKAKIFTLYFKSITMEDISLITGDLSKNSTYLWNKILKDLPNDANGEDIKQYMDKKHQKLKSLSIYRLFIEPAIDNHLLAGKNCPLNINLISEMNDKETISVLFHEYIPSKLWQMFMINYLSRRILFELAHKNKISEKNIMLFREAGDFMKKDDKDLENTEQMQIFRNKLDKIARYGRRGLIPFLDTQSAKDTKNLIEGQEDLLIIKETSINDVEEIIKKLRSERRISKVLVNKIYELDKNEMIIVERRQKAVKVSLQPPKTMCYNGRDSFLKVWKKEYGDYLQTHGTLKIISDLYEKSEKQMLSLKSLKEEFQTETSVIESKKIMPKYLENIEEELVPV